MIITLGSLLIIIAIAAFILPIIGVDNSFTKSIKGRLQAVFGVAGLALLVGVNGMFFMADAAENYVLQYPWGGTETIVNENGLKLRLWASVIRVDQEIAIKHLPPDNWAKYQDGTWEDSGDAYLLPAGDFEFNDAIVAHIGNAVVLETGGARNIDGFTQLAINTKNEEGLVYNRIVPLINVATKTTAKLMAAQEYIYGASSDFDKWFMDQLQNGTYELEIDEIVSLRVDTVGAPSNINSVSSGGSTDLIRYIIKRDTVKTSPNFGEPIRINQGLSRYGITVVQADADNIDWEGKFDTRLDELKDIVASRQKSFENTQLAIQETRRIVEEGERDKAEEQARLEKEQIQKVIDAETAVKVAEQQLAEEQLLRQKAEVEAEKIRTLADAEAFKNKQLVSAGLTPQERAELELKKADVVSANLSKLQMPSTMIIGGEQGNGGSQGSDGILSLLISSELAKGMLTSDTP